MRYTAEIKRSIVFCVKINLLISITPREPLLRHTVMVPALTDDKLRTQETDSPLIPFLEPRAIYGICVGTGGNGRLNK